MAATQLVGVHPDFLEHLRRTSGDPSSESQLYRLHHREQTTHLDSTFAISCRQWILRTLGTQRSVGFQP